MLPNSLTSLSSSSLVSSDPGELTLSPADTHNSVSLPSLESPFTGISTAVSKRLRPRRLL